MAGVDHTGGYATSVPIEVPRFYGLEPEVALAYDSNGGNDLAGVGWRLEATSYIVRAGPRAGTPAYDSSDVFLLDGSELVPCSNQPNSASPSCTTGGSHSTKLESFVKILKEGENWYVWSKDGTRSTYKPEPNLGSTLATYRWALVEREDTHGNTVEYSYGWSANPTAPAFYLEQIVYGNASSALRTEIDFQYERRPDPYTYATGTALTRVRLRLKTITVRAAGSLLRAYALDYNDRNQQGDLEQKDVQPHALVSVQQYGRDATIDASGNVTQGATGPLPAKTFKTTGSGGGWSYEHERATFGPPWLDKGGVTGAADWNDDTSLPWDDWHGAHVRWFPGDVDADGRQDFVGTYVETDASGVERIQLRVAHANRDGTYTRTVMPTPWPYGNHANPEWRLMPGDVNGDGRTDVMATIHDPTTNTAWLHTALAKPDWVPGLAPFTFPSAQETRITGGDPRNRWFTGDANGDGKSDFMVALRTGPNGFANYDHATFSVAVSKGDGSYNELPPDETDWSFDPEDDPYWFTGDANGDGRADFLRVTEEHHQAEPFFTAGLGYAYSAGDGTFTATARDTGRDWRASVPLPDWAVLGDAGNDLVQSGDFDADGRVDLVFMTGVKDQTYQIRTYTALSSRGGTVEDRLALPAAYQNAHWSREHGTGDFPNQWTSGDLNGDDATDFVIAVPTTFGTNGDKSSGWPTTTRIVKLISKKNGEFEVKPPYGTGWTHDCWKRSKVCPEGPKFQVFAADATGDGRADVMYAGYREVGGNELTSLRVDVSPTTGDDARRWQPADISGDGLRDLVYVQYTNPGIRVYTSLGGRPGGSTPVSPESDDVLPAFDEPNMGPWMLADVGSPGGAPDGKADLVYPYYSGSGVSVYTLLSKGDGKWEAKPGPSGTFAWATPYRDTWAWRAMDVDGDGRGDLVHASQRGLGIGVHTLLSNGSGTWTGVDEPHAAGFGAADTPNWKQADVNGDGRADLVHVLFAGSANQVVATLLSKGGGHWRARSDTLALPVTDTADWRVAELNGDGKTDLVNVASSPSGIDLDVLVSLGDAEWQHETPHAAQAASMPTGGATHQWRLLDVNDDGLDDLARVDSAAVDTLLNGHEGWRAQRDPHDITAKLGATISDVVGWRPTDDDADGRDDLLFARPGSGEITFVGLRSTWPDRRLVEHENGLGTSTSIRYRSSRGTHAHMPVGATLRLVDAVTVAVHTNSTTVRYTYEGGRWSHRERRFLGFAARVESDGTTRLATEYGKQTPACASEPTREALTDSAGSILRTTDFELADSSKTGQPPYRCTLTHRAIKECEGTPKCRVTSTTFGQDAYGNVTRVVEEGEFVDANADGIDDLRQDNRARVTTYVPNGSDYIVGLPASKHVWDYSHGSALVAVTEYVYDGNATSADPPTVGDVRVEEAWNDKSGAVVRTRYAYDGHGNLKRVTLPSGRWSSIDYDPTHELFPVVRCNALQHCVSYQWDYNLGKPRSEEDANGKTTWYEHDALARLKRVDFPDGGCLAYSYLDFGTPASQRVREVACDKPIGRDGPATGLERVRYLDGQGRLWKETRSGPYTREVGYADTSPAVAYSTTWYAPGEKPTVERFEYDAAKRLRFVRHADGSAAETRYQVGAEIRVDELGHETVFFRDAYGRVERVREQVTETGRLVDHDTTYAYDPLDRLTRVVDAAGNVSTTEWNSLGHPLRKCDPDAGCWQYGYDDDGRLDWRIDARGRKIGFTYDGVGRLETKDYYTGGVVTKQARFHYDTDPASGARLGASVGRLTRVEDPAGGGSEQYVYDAMGRAQSTEKCVGSDCLSWETSYDVLGRVERIVYPDGEPVDHLYDGAGRLETVSSYATKVLYDSNDRVKEIEFGNGTKASFGYHPTRHWLASQGVLDPSGTSLLSASYGYDGAAHLKTLDVSNPSPTSLSLDYDELGRLLSVRGSRSEEFQYDALGNITWSSAGGVYDYADPDHVHAVTDVEAGPAKGSYSYDANGSMLSGAGRAFTWDDDRLPVEITAASGTTTFAYDALGRRVEKSGPNGTTRYFSPLAERDANGNLVKHYYAGQRLIARSNAQGLGYFHLDLIGSTRLVTDATGSVVRRNNYEAFGALAGATAKGAGAPVEDLGFAGQRADDETGLVYMNARYYDPVLARFVSADTVVPDPLNPQALNRYSYAYNDPFAYVDPSGHEPINIRKREDGPSMHWDVDLFPRNSGRPPDLLIVPEARSTPFDRKRTSVLHTDVQPATPASDHPRQQRDLDGDRLNWKSTLFTTDDGTAFEWIWDADSATKFWVGEFEYAKSSAAAFFGALSALITRDTLDDTALVLGVAGFVGPKYSGSAYGRVPERIRQAVLKEAPVCPYCGSRPSTVVDHIKSKKQDWVEGGYKDTKAVRTQRVNALPNLTGACNPCNSGGKQAKEIGTGHGEFTPELWKP